MDRSVNPSSLPAAPCWVEIAAKCIRWLPVGRYRLSHWLGRCPPQAFLTRLPQRLGGASFRCNLRDAIAREVCFTGIYEPQETALVQALLRPGMTFLDVGANWGYFTLLAAHLVGISGRVVSLEPDPRLFPTLQENVARNCLTQVTALPVAAADKAGILSLAGYEEDGENWGLSRVVCARQAGGGPSFAVTATALDDVLDECHVGTVDLLKIDIEGAEGFALTGLARSLAQQRIKRLLLELHPAQLAEHGQSPDEVLGKLRAAGYRAWAVDHSPRANRRAAYAGHLDMAALLRPFDAQAALDSWPHLLWTVPGWEPCDGR
jgi:FkbM family methyltransferase